VKGRVSSLSSSLPNKCGGAPGEVEGGEKERKRSVQKEEGGEKISGGGCNVGGGVGGSVSVSSVRGGENVQGGGRGKKQELGRQGSIR